MQKRPWRKCGPAGIGVSACVYVRLRIPVRAKTRCFKIQYANLSKKEIKEEKRILPNLAKMHKIFAKFTTKLFSSS